MLKRAYIQCNQFSLYFNEYLIRLLQEDKKTKNKFEKKEKKFSLLFKFNSFQRTVKVLLSHSQAAHHFFKLKIHILKLKNTKKIYFLIILIAIKLIMQIKKLRL